MKISKKIVAIVTLIVCIVMSSMLLASCNDQSSDPEVRIYRFTAPEGTPALAMLRLPVDNKVISGVNMIYEVVSASNIASEMSSKKSDLVIMPVNAGAKLIMQGAQYKLVSVAVDGSLYMVGKMQGKDTIEMTDIIGKKVACIGKTGVPGLVFRHILAKNNINVIEAGEPNEDNREVFVKYVADGTAARTELANTENGIDFAVVGEPAATVFKNTDALKLNVKMNLQEEYKKVNENVDTYPQAGLFVKAEIAADSAFMDGLFTALAASKEWVFANKTEVTTFAKENLYESAAFPPASLANCAINAEKLTDKTKGEIIAFLKNVAAKDTSGNAIDWDGQKEKLF